MSRRITLIGIIVLAIVALFTWLSIAPRIVAGGVVASTRTQLSSISGDAEGVATTTSQVNINPNVSAIATSSLVASIGDVDQLGFILQVANASTTNACVGIRFQASTASTSAATAGWEDIAPYPTASGGAIVATSSSPVFFCPNPQNNASSTMGVAFALPNVPALYIRALVYAEPGITNNNFSLWYGFVPKRSGFNTGN